MRCLVSEQSIYLIITFQFHAGTKTSRKQPKQSVMMLDSVDEQRFTIACISRLLTNSVVLFLVLNISFFSSYNCFVVFRLVSAFLEIEKFCFEYWSSQSEVGLCVKGIYTCIYIFIINIYLHINACNSIFSII